ncbi:prolyl oligopeptidase family serine peptidase [Flavilitoribacter nigricans]|uniref:prolyl oligopeptidase n=1 Tax=Flavilitoribacter nigricans (strain ATCC 23147 / DSM 23189 / NBRC 102662 / NCIMB 1420 / SS-2) TaxID=1122177 RepID=A0A2D0MYT4_FLAN2|nr:prolyl oligopeptidase family serine peptidase [Flavilitoribacter nigricans]PHN01340.1 S9 family peptidase [Flavilitoribacter nigricans DSM 23189 = NBRC 102662]
MKKLLLLQMLFLSFLFACNTEVEPEAEALQYPETTKGDHVDTYHGVEVADPYQWLEDDLSEETTDWVQAQNVVTDGYLDKIDFREPLKARIEELMDYERISAPFEEGDYEYFYKNDGLQDHSVLYRTPLKDENAQPEVFLDPNTFSDDGTVGLRGVYFTKDGSLAAYMITEGGSDWRKVIVINTGDKAIIGDTLVDVKFSGLSWMGNEGFYYSSYDNPKETSELSAKTQHHELYYHQLNTPQSEDELIYGGAKQPNRYIGGTVTEDGNYLVVTGAQNTSGAQVYVKDLRKANSPFIQLQDDYFARFSYVENEGDDFYFNTNIDAPNYRLVKVNIQQPEKTNWEDVIPETENVLRVNSGGGKFFANYLVDAKTAIKQFDMTGKLERDVQLPGIGSAGGFGAKKDDTHLYYSFTSFTYPSTIYRYNIATGESEMYRQAEVDFNPDDYETKQVFYNSKDGTRVPMFIVHKKGLKMDGTNPTYLYAYGGFNISLTPSFSASRIVWLENGGIYAQPNIRGGGEYGEKWHKAGTQMNKQNVFDDFIAAGEYLIQEGYTSSDYLAISGGSNGGLLVGATMAQRPDLAKVALPAVGVMDMLKYHTFTAGAGWAADYGTAEDSPEMFEYLKGYSPYHSLKEGVAYPATMVTTADHDDRVVPAHSFKFAARLQEAHVGANPVLIRIETKAGHGSVSTKQGIELAADRYAFVWHNMGIEPTFAKEVPN